MTDIDLRSAGSSSTTPARGPSDDVGFTLEGENITALVGPNGAGKMTLACAAIAGLDCIPPMPAEIKMSRGLACLGQPRDKPPLHGFLADSYGSMNDSQRSSNACSIVPAS